MTISYISRHTLMLGIAILIALSLLVLAFAALHGIPSSGVSHTSAHLMIHGWMLTDGGNPPPPCPPFC